MVDKPKASVKISAPEAPSFEMIIMGTIGIFVLIFLIVVPAVLTSFNIDSNSFYDLSSLKETIITFISKVFTTITFVAVFLTLICLFLIIYLKGKKEQILATWKSSEKMLPVDRQKMSEFFVNGPVLLDADTDISHGPVANAGNEKWLDIENKINSVNHSDWRLAILEADILLDDMLKQMGLPGDSLGERLKSAHSSFFSTIDEAWNAHKIRNIIAHQGSSYDLTYTEARKVIDLYRRVFEEFYFI